MKVSGEELSGEEVSGLVFFLGGYCPGGNFSGVKSPYGDIVRGELTGEDCPRGNLPVTTGTHTRSRVVGEVYHRGAIVN